MSLDAAHSLVDSFDLENTLMDRNTGKPFRVGKNPFIQGVEFLEGIKVLIDPRIEALKKGTGPKKSKLTKVKVKD
jgi:hypothetical protein